MTRCASLTPINMILIYLEISYLRRPVHNFIMSYQLLQPSMQPSDFSQFTSTALQLYQVQLYLDLITENSELMRTENIHFL